MPLPRFDKLAPERKRVLLDAALAEFAERGYKEASLNQIIAAAGVSKGALYYWFADKADLYQTVIEDLFGEMLAAEDGVGLDFSLLSAAEFWEQFAAWSHAATQGALSRPEVRALARDAMALYTAGERAIFSRIEALGQGWIDGFVARGVELGVIRSDLPAALLARIGIALDTVLDHWYVSKFEAYDPAEVDAMVAVYVDLFRRVWEPR
ncbi:MAG: TetR/AcrR family transcriptional regulator [Deltaproteobacteria bacterium]|nr:TetR/AcrR family transcriptional regulator [Deltaproteobacteria bacterium]